MVNVPCFKPGDLAWFRTNTVNMPWRYGKIKIDPGACGLILHCEASNCVYTMLVQGEIVQAREEILRGESDPDDSDELLAKLW